MRALSEFPFWRRTIRAAQEVRLFHLTAISGCLAIAALNLLWQGHGVLRSSSPAPRFFAVALSCWMITVVAEFVWLFWAPLPIAQLVAIPQEVIVFAPEPADPLIEQLKEVAPAVLREGTLQLAEEMKSFEAGSDQEFVRTLLETRSGIDITEEEHEEALDRQSNELVQRHLVTWRGYRDRFHRPARAFRDELRRRLGIRNPASEPVIPALYEAVLTGANPISQAADHLVSLARRLR